MHDGFMVHPDMLGNLPVTLAVTEFVLQRVPTRGPMLAWFPSRSLFQFGFLYHFW